MALQTNYENVNGDLIDKGEYEVLIVDYATGVTINGASKLDLHMVIRNDVDQKFVNRRLIDTIWLDSQKSIEWKFNTISKAVGIPAGTNFDSIEEWADNVLNTPFRVIVKHEEYDGKTNARVSGYNPTRNPQVRHVTKATATTPANQVDDDDLPF